MTLIQVTVRTRADESVVVTGEQVSPNFALTPGITTLEDGTAGISEGLGLTHIHTGLQASRSMWLDLRDLAARLEALPIEWATMTTLTADERALAADTVKAAQKAWADRDDTTDFPTWAGDPTKPALSLLGTLLDGEAKAGNRFDIHTELSKQVGALDADLGRKVDGALLWRAAGANVDGYSAVYLLAVLHRVDPEAADRAARYLAGALDAGDSLAEWIYQWREEIGAGRPLTLHGFADINLVDGGLQ